MNKTFLQFLVAGALFCVFLQKSPAQVTYINGNPVNTTIAYGGSWTYSVSWVASFQYISGFNQLFFSKNYLLYIYNNYPTNGSFSYTISGVTSADDGNYYIEYINSASPRVYLHVSPAILSQPVATTCLSGATTSMGISAGPSTATFQWIDAATGTVLATGTSFTAATSMDGKLVFCKISNNYGSVNSSSVLLRVGTAPSISSQPASVSTDAGQNATFNITASGTAPLNYSWYKGGLPVSGANLSTLTVYAVTPTNGGTYSCVVSNTYGKVTSANATLTVINTLPVILTQPTNNYIAPGQIANFSVTATGYSPLSYAWYKNGVLIPGANLNFYQLLSVTNSDIGTYACSISNLYGKTNTASVTLSLGYSPVITNQPQSHTVNQGQSVGLIVGADGRGTTVNYQWLQNGSAIEDATNLIYSLTNAAFANQANYTARAFNNWGSVTSAIATLIVQAPPSITAQPTSFSSAVGDSFQLIIAATGSPLLSYQWLKDGNSLFGATNTIYQVSSTLTSDAGAYVVIITNNFGSVTSSLANITVDYKPPVIIQQPTDLVLMAGSNANFSVTATGSALNYQWYKFPAVPTNVAAATPVIINGFMLGVTVTNGGAGYTVVPNVWINDTTGSGATATAVLSNGVVALINVIISGSNYSSSAWVTINPPAMTLNGQTNSTLNLPANISSDAGAYFVVVSNPVGSATSSNATLTVQTPVFILMQPHSQNVVPGVNANFSVVAGGDTPLNYQWWVQPTAATATAAALILNGFVYGTTVTSGGYGYVATPNVSFVGGGGIGASALAVVSNGMVTSINMLATGLGYTNPPILQIDPPPALMLSTQTNPVCILLGVSTNDAGNYFVIVTNAYGSVTSTQATLSVGAGFAPTITRQPISQYAIVGGTPSFGVTATGTPVLFFHWLKNGSNLPAATLATFTILNTITNDTGSYVVVVTNSFGSTTSAVANLVVGLPPQKLKIGAHGKNEVQLELSGTPNYPYVLLSATNLLPPVRWLPLLTNAADTNGVWQFTDTNLNSSQKFYRSVGQ